MREVLGLAKRLATSWRGDLLLAVVTAAWAFSWCAAAAPGDQHWAILFFVPPFSAGLTLRRRWPLTAVALACAALVAVRPLGQAGVLDNALTFPVAWTVFLICYSLGVDTGLLAGLAGAVVLAAGLQIENGAFSPVIEMITFGPWLAGRIVLSRRILTEQLQARNTELQAEQELFTRESVRYERARIARELHDIVAHCLSAMVVQASAGQRVPEADRAGLAQALVSVAQAAAQAQEEIGRLVELIVAELPAGTSANLQMVDELVRRAAVTGLSVSCRFAGACDQLAPAASEAGYRVVQEALTNSLKHAPGAPVMVTISAQGSQVEISVVNSAAQQAPSGLERSGGRYGLAAMRERVTACGGSLNAGPAAAGGWQVLALLPARLP